MTLRLIKISLQSLLLISPIACLIPKDSKQLLVGDKAISVTHIVNGTTRLQPVVMQIGQASGLIAAILDREGVNIDKLNIRTVQQALLSADGYIMPTYDVSPQDRHFKAIQRIAACGILRLTGEPYKWANRSWFYPEEALNTNALAMHLKEYKQIGPILKQRLSVDEFCRLV